MEDTIRRSGNPRWAISRATSALRDHADDMTAVRERGIGDDTHQAHTAAAEHDVYATLAR